jgi:hypothetical protein
MDNASPPLPPNAAVLQLLAGKWISSSISVAATLGVAEHLAKGPKTPAELAADLGAHALSLYRVLRALASVGVFAEDADGRFSNTPLSAVLRSDAPDSIRGMALFMGLPESWASWSAMLHTLHTGESAFEHQIGEHFFSYAAKNSAVAAIFNEAMIGMSAHVAEAVVEAFDFSSVATLADIGGGHGGTLASILAKHRGMRGVLFDQPDVVVGARPFLEGAGVAERVEVVGGDFFKEVPAGADGYLLKYVMHDWDDARAVQILKTVHRAASPSARLFLVDAVIAAGNAPDMGKLIDLQMLVTLTGRERTEKEFTAILSEAGFSLSRVVPTASHLSVIEAARI